MIGTGLGGGIVIGRHVVKGVNGFGGEVGHVLVPYGNIAGIDGIRPACNCGRTGDLESLCSLTAIERTLLPYSWRAIPDTNCTPTRRRPPPSACAAWPIAATRSAARCSACRRMRSGCYSTR